MNLKQYMFNEALKTLILKFVTKIIALPQNYLSFAALVIDRSSRRFFQEFFGKLWSADLKQTNFNTLRAGCKRSARSSRMLFRKFEKNFQPFTASGAKFFADCLFTYQRKNLLYHSHETYILQFFLKQYFLCQIQTTNM